MCYLNRVDLCTLDAGLYNVYTMQLCVLQTSVFGRPFVKQFAYPVGPLSVCHVCLRRWCTVAKRLDGSRCHFGMDVGLCLGPGADVIVLDGDQALPYQKGGTAALPPFGSCLSWPNGWMAQDATWYRDRPRLRPHALLHGYPAPPKGHNSPTNFRSCLLWPNGWRD